MMKEHRAVITTGEYDGYRIIGFVVGPARASVSSLWRGFKKEFNLPDYSTPTTDAGEIVRRYQTWRDAEARLQALGYDGKAYLNGGIAAQFIQWLKERGFKDEHITEINC